MAELSQSTRSATLNRRSILSSLVALPTLAHAQGEAQLTVFAADSLKDALNKAGWVYVAQTLHPVRLTYGASSELARQIQQGAPADVVISDDSEWMDYLEKKHLIVVVTRRNLFSNHLALIASAKSKVSLSVGWKMPIDRVLGGGRLAMAAPDLPAGRYGQVALTKLGVWDQVKDHIAPAEDAGATLNFVIRGESPLGIAFVTDAKVAPGVRIVGLFPDSSHPPILYSGAVLAGSINPNAAGFLTALTAPAEANVFRNFGFRVLKG